MMKIHGPAVICSRYLGARRSTEAVAVARVFPSFMLLPVSKILIILHTHEGYPLSLTALSVKLDELGN